MKTEKLEKIIAYMLYTDENLNIFQIDKMLYLIQAYSLVKYDKPAFNNKIVCGFFGATIPDFSKNLRRYNLLSYKNEDYNSLDNDLKEIINSVIKNYKDYKGISLGGLTMTYIQFYKNDDFKIEEIGKLEITKESILKNHNERLEKEGYIF